MRKRFFSGWTCSREGELYEWVIPEVEIIKSHPLAARVVTALQLDATKGESASEADTAARFEKAVTKFQNALTVENTRKSNIIEISYEANDPRLAATVVNQAIATYVNYRSELYNESESYKFFQEQISIAEEKLNTLEQSQAEFKQQKEILSPQEQRTILLTRMADYEKSLTAVRMPRSILITRLTPRLIWKNSPACRLWGRCGIFNKRSSNGNRTIASA